MSGQRRPASAARVAAAKARDEELAGKAAAVLADPQFGARVAALVDTAPRLTHYSLRNLGLLLGQAADRGMVLTEVDSYEGWQDRGRQVRTGEKGLKITRGGGRASGGGNGSGDGRDGGRPQFRTVSRFDISQTDPVEDLDGEADEPTAAELAPAVVLFDSLSEQAERAGYLTAVWPDERREEPVRVDDDSHVIDVYGEHTPETLGLLASMVADIILTRPKPEKPPGGPRRTRPARERPGTGRGAADELVITVM